MYRISVPAFVFSLFLFVVASTGVPRDVHAQETTPVKPRVFTHEDTLRGSVTPERAWWNVLRYDLEVTPDYKKKTIQGVNRIGFRVVAPGQLMQIDLQEPMEIRSILFRGSPLSYSRKKNIFLVEFPGNQAIGDTGTLAISFEGRPREAVKPPWDGGWVWTRDSLGRPWMTVTCQAIGASCWYPCKDYQGDEPDNGASLSVIVPDTLVAVGNGRLIGKTQFENGRTRYSWSVASPINNYCLVTYIGKYVDVADHFPGAKGLLDVDYWVLDYDREKATGYMKPEVQRMLRCFEYWFGPYPFYEDGYKLVDAPYVGMENQTAIAYGNRFQGGYLGHDQSRTGWGDKWDFIIVHESGHEWFANSITSRDLADWWIHEGFTTYSETLYTVYYYGKAAGNAYNAGLRAHILNNEPVIGPYGVNYDGTEDAYYKASNMIHMIRQILRDDTLFRQILIGLNRTFYHQTVTTGQVEQYISLKAKIDFSKVFDQYLRSAKVPVLQYKVGGGKLSYRWANCVSGFDMQVPVEIGAEETKRWITPREDWGSIDLKGNSPATKKTQLSIDPNFYVNIQKLD